MPFPVDVPQPDLRVFRSSRRLRIGLILGIAAIIAGSDRVSAVNAEEPIKFGETIGPLLKEKCVKCHGPAKAEAKLDLSTAAAVARGGESGPIVAPHEVDESSLWERIAADEMPPKHPLTHEEKELVRKWIIAGAPGLPGPNSTTDAEHWAFRKLTDAPVPPVKDHSKVRNSIDNFIQSEFERLELPVAAEAPRERLIRRVSLTLTGLPPTPGELQSFLNDSAPDAFARMVNRYLASDRYGEKWGKYWLDAAGYTDSNGYFNADSDRPLAYRYRDYVIRTFNQDKPFDRFILEQIAGDEIPGFVPGSTVEADIAERLIATHFLRNGQDGSGESDGNPDELRVDRYAALESCQQIVSSALLGLTMHCAKCHSHKFEPISHEDYFRFQAIFVPAFPAAEGSLWIKPQNRIVIAPTAGEKLDRERKIQTAQAELNSVQASLTEWIKSNRPNGEVIFSDDFDNSGKLAPRWSNVAPTDNHPGGNPPVSLDADTPPAARIRNGRLEIVAGGTSDSWLTTTTSFDWTPNEPGEAIQVTFDLIDTRLTPTGSSAERIGYFIATHDFDDDGKVAGGNILVDGHPGGPTAVFLDYPGSDAVQKGSIGRTGYMAGRNYGVRVTNAGESQFRLEHLVDGFPEDGEIRLNASELPDGGFGFEYHGNRSFIVDNVRVERFAGSKDGVKTDFATKNGEFRRRNSVLNQAKQTLTGLTNDAPSKISLTTDLTAKPPVTHLLERGDYAKPAAVTEPAPPSALTDGQPFPVTAPADGRTTGRRLALAKWLTDPNHRAAWLMARVQVNRIWQHHFGTGIVTTPENLGLSGAEPTNPELLDWLAFEFVRSGWSVKHMHRVILGSATFRRGSDGAPASAAADRTLARFPTTRLDAESIRDAMLAVSGELDTTMGGPYVPFLTKEDGAIVVPDNGLGGKRRSVYLQQRRTQPISMLQVFDAPTIVFNSVRRPRTAMPLQALTLLNSEFVRARATAFAGKLERLQPDDSKRVAQAFLEAYSRAASPEEHAAAVEFLQAQAQSYGADSQARRKALVDLCHSILISNEFLYLD